MSLPAGYAPRAPRTADAGRVAALLRVTEEQDFGEPEAAADELAADWQTFDLESDAVLVEHGVEEHGVEVVGYGYFFRRGAAQAIIDVYVSPAHAGRGIGTWLVAELERRAGKVARIGSGITRANGAARAILLEAFGEFHRRGEHTVVLNVDSESLTGATRLYESVGMQVTREIDAFECALA